MSEIIFDFPTVPQFNFLIDLQGESLYQKWLQLGNVGTESDFLNWLKFNGSNFTTVDVTDTTNKRYQTDTQKLYNDATSSIQTQLNGKQANLGFTPYNSTNPSGYISSVPAQSFASLTGKPTTLGGYGITDSIKNQNASAQTANMWISGGGTFDSSVTASGYNFSGNSFGEKNSGLFFNGVGNYASGILSDLAGTTLNLQSGGGIALSLSPTKAATFASSITATGLTINGAATVQNAAYTNFDVKSLSSNDTGGAVLRFSNQTKEFAQITGETESASNGQIFLRTLKNGVITQVLKLASTGAATFSSSVTATNYTATNLPIYADNTSAASLAVGSFYRTLLGVLMVKY